MVAQFALLRRRNLVDKKHKQYAHVQETPMLLLFLLFLRTPRSIFGIKANKIPVKMVELVATTRNAEDGQLNSPLLSLPKLWSVDTVVTLRSQLIGHENGCRCCPS